MKRVSEENKVDGESKIYSKGTTHKSKWDGHSIDSSTVQYRSMTRSSVPRADSDLKSKYCFCAHMHEMMKYFLFTEIHKQCLNQLSVPSWESSICRRIDRVTIPSESIPLVKSSVYS